MPICVIWTIVVVVPTIQTLFVLFSRCKKSVLKFIFSQSESRLKDDLASVNSKVGKLQKQIKSLEKENDNLKNNERALARDLIKQQNITKETIKAMDKLAERNIDDKKIIQSMLEGKYH